MATTASGIWYPDTSTPMSIHDILQQLAQSVDTVVTNRAVVRCGTVLVTPTAANTIVQFNVTFRAALPATPAVTLTPQTVANAQCFAYASSVTATGFVINFRRDSATGTNVSWVAVVDPGA